MLFWLAIVWFKLPSLNDELSSPLIDSMNDAYINPVTIELKNFHWRFQFENWFTGFKANLHQDYEEYTTSQSNAWLIFFGEVLESPCAFTPFIACFRSIIWICYLSRPHYCNDFITFKETAFEPKVSKGLQISNLEQVLAPCFQNRKSWLLHSYDVKCVLWG